MNFPFQPTVGAMGGSSRRERMSRSRHLECVLLHARQLGSIEEKSRENELLVDGSMLALNGSRDGAIWCVGWLSRTGSFA